MAEFSTQQESVRTVATWGSRPTHPRYVMADSSDPLAFGAQAIDWSHTYEPLKSRQFFGQLRGALFDNIQIAYERVNGTFRYSGRAPRGSRIFQSLLGGTGELHLDGRPVTAGQIVTSRWDQLGQVTCKGGAETLIVVLEEDSLQRYASALGCEQVIWAMRAPAMCTRDPSLKQRFDRAVRNSLEIVALDAPDLDRESIATELKQRIIDIVLELLADPEQDRRLTPPKTRHYIVNRAIELIDQSLAEQFSIADICTKIRVAERTLRYSFEDVLGMTPTKYIRASRLNRVRRELLSGREMTVENAAVRSGFWHMGRFARYYRQAFGENPAHTYRASHRSLSGFARSAFLSPECQRVR